MAEETKEELSFAEASKREREFILGALKDPAKVTLPGTEETVVDYRARLQQDERERGKKQLKRDEKAMRDSSSAPSVTEKSFTLTTTDAAGVQSIPAVVVIPSDPDAIPEDFPHKELLGSYEKVSVLREAPDEELLQLDGVGPATVKAWRAALKKIK